ncbi:MAG: phage tail tape measure protein [Anaerolineae bacterium]
MVQVASLFGLLNLRDNMTPGLNSALGNAQNFSSRLTSTVTSNVQRLGTVMTGVALTGATAFAGLSVAGIRQFSNLERGMNEVFTLMPGISQAAMDDMTLQTNIFAERFGNLPENVIPALYQSLSAGVPQDNVFAFLETAQMAATGGITDLQTSVDGISSVMNAYGAEVVSAQQASDLMFTAVRLGKTNFEELSSSLFNVIPTASSLGVQFGDVTAGLAAITSQGVPTSVATTQMRQLFVELGDSASGVGEIFSQVAGQSFQDFIADGNDVSDALQLLYDHAEDTGLNIDQLFSSVEAGGAALALTGQGADRFASFLGEMQNATGATEAAFGTMNTGIARSVDFLSSSFSVFLSNVGSVMAPIVGPVIDVLTTFFRIINNGLDSGETMSDWLGDLPGFLQPAGQFVGQIAAGFHNMGLIIGNLSGAATAGGNALGLFFTVFEDGSSYLSEIIAGFGASQESAQSLATGIINLATTIGNIIAPIAAFIQQNVQMSDVLMGIGIAIASVVIPAVVSLVAPIVGTFALLVGAVALLRTAWQNNVGGIQEHVGNFANWFTGTAMPAVVGFITGTVIPTFFSFIDTLTQIWDDVSPTLTSLFDWFTGTGLPLIGEFINTVFLPIVDMMVDNIVTIWDTVSPYLTSLYDWFVTTGLPGIGEYITGPFTTFITGMTDLLGSIWDLVSPALTIFRDSVVGIFTFIIDNAITPVQNAISAVTGSLSFFTQGAGNILSGASNFIDNINPFNNTAGQRASGGPVTAGRQYLVGEEGPELFTPSSSGSIASNQQTMAMSGAGGDSFNFYGDIVTSDPEDFMRQLAQRRRRRE